MIWVYVGPDDLARYWEWQWRPHREFYDKYLRDFFAYDAAPYLTILYIAVGLFLLLLVWRLMIFLAKLFTSFVLALTALWILGAENVGQPPAYLWAVLPFTFGWIVFTALLQGDAASISLRGIWRRLRS